MAVVMRPDWFDRDFADRHRLSKWMDDWWLDDFKDWPSAWPQPRLMMDKFGRSVKSEDWWKDWPAEWPKMDAVMPRFASQLDRVDRDWRRDPFWMELYPRWAEPVFKDGIDVQSNIFNDQNRFAVEIDAYQFKPEEIQVKTLDDTLLIEGRHEDVKDNDNFTKMYFVRKYQLPRDVDTHAIQSSIDARGRLAVEAPKRGGDPLALTGGGKKSAAPSPRDRHDSGFSNGYASSRSPLHIDAGSEHNGYARQEQHSSRSRSSSRLNGELSRDRELSDYNKDRDVGYGVGSRSRTGSRLDIRSEFDDRQREFEERARQLDREFEEKTRQFGSRGGRDVPIARVGDSSRAQSRNGGESNGGYSTYRRSESRTRTEHLSPHDVTMNNEARANGGGVNGGGVSGGGAYGGYQQQQLSAGSNGQRRASFDTRETGARSASRASESREQYSRSQSRNQMRDERDKEIHIPYNNTYTGGVTTGREINIPINRVGGGAYSTTSESRNGYRVDSPSSYSSVHRQPESTTESVRSVHIMRKTQQHY